jgi:hypothetical protein
MMRGAEARAVRWLLLSTLVALAPACGGSDRGIPFLGTPPNPVLTGVAPAEVHVGDEIEVSGSGFGSAPGGGTVTVSGSGAAIVAWSDTLIRATVPAGATSGAVVVTVGGTSSNAGSVLILWSATNPQNLPICIVTGGQMASQVTPDGAGGAIIVWGDGRNGLGDIYAQRVSSAGVVQWAANGIPICTASQTQAYPSITADGSGGAFIAWEDRRSGTGEIYAQRVDGAGTVQWAANGVVVCAAPDERGDVRIIPDGSGGIVLAWHDLRSGTNSDIYAQRLDGSGAPQWMADGVPICVTPTTQQYLRITADGTGGAIVVWADIQPTTYYDIYAQRVNGAGTLLWTAGGVPISTVVDSQLNPEIVTDGSGGAIMVWRDRRSGNTRIYGQRIDGAGATQWPADGQPICTAGVGQDYPQLVSDGAGGAIVVFEGVPIAPGMNIYAQRVDKDGTLLWAGDGAAVCTEAGEQMRPRVVPDGHGGAVVIWYDNRVLTPTEASTDIYAQRVNAAGATLWTSGGVAVRTASNSSFPPPSIAPDGTGGAIVVWEDFRSGTETHIYAQGISPGGLQ